MQRQGAAPPRSAGRNRCAARADNYNGGTGRKHMRKVNVLGCLVAAACLVGPTQVSGEETLKLAVGQRTLWDTSISELGQRGGIFKKHGLNLEILYTQGAGETQQAVIAGSVDVGSGKTIAYSTN